jgi:nucleoside triphosphate diphosphatase
MTKKTEKSFHSLIETMDKLLSPQGCPWDRKQTHESLVQYMYEEAGEIESAIKKKDWENLKEELGDLLLQVLFHSALAKAKNRFDINDVVKTLDDKLVRRHPHVFGGKKLKCPKAVLRQWDEIKKEEKRLKNRKK